MQALYALTFLLASPALALTLTRDLRLPTQQAPVQMFHTAGFDNLALHVHAALEGAKSSVLIYCFNFSDPDALRLLGQKAEEGVSVSIVTDADQMLTLMALATPKVALHGRDAGSRKLHHSIIVIDKELVFVGSCDIGKDDFRLDQNTILGVYAPELATYIDSDIWDKQPFETTLGSKKLAFYNLPAAPEQLAIADKARGALIDLIDAAKSSLEVHMSLFTDSKLASAVGRARKRGVNLHLEIDKPGAALLAEDVTLPPKQHPFRMNSKWMLVDKRILVVGSFNWSELRNADDSFIVLDTEGYLPPGTHSAIAEDPA